MLTLRRFIPLLFPATLLFAAGCASARQDVSPYRPCGQRAVIFSVDGAGGWHSPSQAIREAIQAENLPIGLEVVEWSHGYGRVILDHLDYENTRAAGQCLAQQICQWRAVNPWLEINIVGHSAGCGVVLACTEFLPPCTLDHIVLLAPSISSCYDVKPALRSVRKDVSVFHSHRDRVLFFGTIFLGTTDRDWPTRVAGRTGFFPQPFSVEDEILYQKLRQYPWDRCLRPTGHYGGHYGSYQPEFLHAYVLPILTPACGDSGQSAR